MGSLMTSILLGFDLALRRYNLTNQLVRPCDGLGCGRQDIVVVEEVVPRQHIEIIP